MKNSSEPKIDLLAQQPRENREKVSTNPAETNKNVFISRVERFASQERASPGPGAYESSIPDKHTVDFRSQKFQQKQKGGLPLQHAWIDGSSRNSYILPKVVQSRLGPGEYFDISQTQPIGEVEHSSWAKGRRFSESKAFENKLGPGQYSEESSAKKKQMQLSVFKSRSPRSFIEELISASKKKALIQRSNPEESQPDEVIRFDETEYEVRKKIDRHSPMFMSKSKRPDLKYESSALAIGPGAYAVNQLKMYRSTAQKGLISAMHYNLAPLSKVKEEKREEVGPGSYQLQSVKSSQRIGKREPLGMMSKAQRFTSHKKKNSLPGPGQYMANRFTMIKEDEIRLKNKGSFIRKPQKNHNFGIAPRATLRNNNGVPFGMYDVRYYDIQHKLDKQNEHFEKLKLMEVTLPAFNSKQHS